jgi:hypothetical protein
VVDIVGKVLNKKYFIFEEIKQDGTFVHYAAEDAFKNRYILLRLIDVGKSAESFQNISDFFRTSELENSLEFVETLSSPYEKFLILKKPEPPKNAKNFPVGAKEPNVKENYASPSLKKLRRTATVREIVLATVFVLVAAMAKILTSDAQTRNDSLFRLPKINRAEVEESFLTYETRIDLYSETAKNNYDEIYAELLEWYNLDSSDPSIWIGEDALECETARDGEFTYLNYYSNSTQAYELLEINEKTGEKRVVSADICASNLTISNDKIYFTNFYDNYYLYSINRDGTNLKRVLKMPVTYLQTNGAGDMLFFVSIDEKDGIPKIFSCSSDGKNVEIFKSSYDENNYDFFNYIRMSDVLSLKKMDFFKDITLKFDYGYSKVLEKDGAYYTVDYIGDVLLNIDKNGERKYLALMADVFLVSDDYVYYQIRGEKELYRYDLKTDESKLIYSDVRNIYAAYGNKLYVSINKDSGNSYSLSELLYESGKYKLGYSYQESDYYKEDTAVYIDFF